MASRYMRLRRRARVATDTCDKPGCDKPAEWWGATIPDGRLRMCDEHKTHYANELLGE